MVCAGLFLSCDNNAGRKESVMTGKTIDATTFFAFLKQYMNQKVSNAPTLRHEVKEAINMIAKYNYLGKMYAAAQYPTTFAECEYTARDIEKFKTRMFHALDVATTKILFLNLLCRELTGQKFVVCLIDRRTNLDRDAQRIADMMKRYLLEDFEHMEKAFEDETMLIRSGKTA